MRQGEGMRYEKEVMADRGDKCYAHVSGSSIGDLLDGKGPTSLVCLRRRGHRGPHAAYQFYNKQIWAGDGRAWAYEVECHAIITFKK